ncbi:MAG: metallophosphoesterase [Pirellulales bacterium]|nr:metallophosphoesterase [Pirellulales bacterium]
MLGLGNKIDRRLLVFLWTVMILCTKPLLATEPFTIVLLPDTQYYTEDPPATNRYAEQTQWIRDNAASENIQFVIHMGDIVDNYNVTSQWQIADAAQAILEGPDPIPHSVMPGNHDMTGSGSPSYTRDASYYNYYFPRSRYSSQSWFGGTYGSTNENNYSLFSVGDLDFMVLCLEPLPRDDAIQWAQDVIDSHPDRRVILASHMLLNPNGQRRVESTYGYLKGNDGTDVYNNFVYDNPNIFLVTSGHISYEALLPSKNAAGNQVYEMLSDYQRGPNGGDGWLRTLQFMPDENRITVGSYSTSLDEYNRFHSYALEYDMGGTVAPPPARPLAALTSRWEFTNDGNDSVGDNDLAFSSGVTIGAGYFGNGLHFDGTSSDYAYETVNPDLSVSEAFSMATWVKYDASNTDLARIFTLAEDDHNICNFGFATGNAASSALVVRILKDDVAYHVITDEQIDRDVFHHVAFSFDDLAGPTASKKIQVWIDGEKATLSEANHLDGVRGVLDGYFLLSRVTDTVVDTLYPFGDEFFSGVLDDMRWYDGVLGDSQAVALQSLPVPGDANGDGQVNHLDASILAGNWGETEASWPMGDFDDDGVIGPRDASILAAHWSDAPSGATGVPEPAAIAVLVMGAVGLLVHGPRKRRS